MASYILSAEFMITVVVPFFVFLRFVVGLYFNSFRALTSLRDRFVFGFNYFDLGKLCLDIFQVALKCNRVLNLGYPS